MEASQVVAAALGRMDRVRQERLRAPLPRLPRRQGRRQRPGRGVHPDRPAAQLHPRRVQVPAHAVGIAARRRRPAAHHHARRARHRDADLARAAGEGPAGGDPVHQVRAGGRPQRPEQALSSTSSRSRRSRRSSSASRPRPRRSSSRAARRSGKQAKCWECHGDGGKGDGEKAAGLKDDFGFPIPPANLTTGQFKSGPSVKDIFRTMTTGLSGTPMPSFSDSSRRRTAGRSPTTCCRCRRSRIR